MTAAPFDLLIAGGGLAGGLTALAVRRARPDLTVGLIECAPTFGGNHIWSSFATDLSAEGQGLAAPLIAHRWPGYTVRFPAYHRHLDSCYQSATSGRLHAALMAELPEQGRFSAVGVQELRPDGALLADGRDLRARMVLDARGAGPAAHLDLGFQKFVGHEVELESPHHLAEPLIMDATVAQEDGYRFVYVLPLGEQRLLIEDTCYADGPLLPTAALAERIQAYARQQGWRIAQVLRTEEGVLPIAMGGDIAAHLAETPAGIAPIGMRAALFHPLTGYSFPDAVTLALKIAGHMANDSTSSSLEAMIRAHAQRSWKQRRYYRMLTRMLFRAARPGERRQVLQHFYRLDAGLVARFYAGHSSRSDKLRILAGKPPVPIGRALAAILKG